jgi:hypothetical protein
MDDPDLTALRFPAALRGRAREIQDEARRPRPIADLHHRRAA